MSVITMPNTYEQELESMEEAVMQDEHGPEFDYFDEHPGEDPFGSAYQNERLELEYKDEVVRKLQNTIEEYLEFSTTRDLVKLIAEML